MLLIFKHIDFTCEMKNFPWQFGLTLSVKENSSASLESCKVHPSRPEAPNLVL